MNLRKTLLSVLVFHFLILLNADVSLSFTGTFSIRHEREVFGYIKNYTIKDNRETLTALALKHDLGYNEITDANPGIDPWYPGKGSSVIIPTSWILPHTNDLSKTPEQSMIIINLAELRLYLLRNGNERLSVTTFPIGIGTEGWNTPTGNYRIIGKLMNPSWTVPESIRRENPELPAVVPPGPENPLGEYAIRLSLPGYLIHGTNKPLGVGRRISHGCIRMYPEDIERLFPLIDNGDIVRIVYQPVKVGFKDNIPFIEVHRDYLYNANQLQEAINLLKRAGLLGSIDSRLLYRAIEEKKGIPLRLIKNSKTREKNTP